MIRGYLVAAARQFSRKVSEHSEKVTYKKLSLLLEEKEKQFNLRLGAVHSTTRLSEKHILKVKSMNVFIYVLKISG